MTTNTNNTIEITKEQMENTRQYLDLIKRFDRVIAIKKDQMEDAYASIDGMKAITYDLLSLHTVNHIFFIFFAERDFFCMSLVKPDVDSFLDTINTDLERKPQNKESHRPNCHDGLATHF